MFKYQLQGAIGSTLFNQWYIEWTANVPHHIILHYSCVGGANKHACNCRQLKSSIHALYRLNFNYDFIYVLQHNILYYYIEDNVIHSVNEMCLL